MAVPDASAVPPQPKRLSDYAPPAFVVDTVDLVFDLDPTTTRVKARLGLRRNPAPGLDPRAPCRLDGDGLTLVGLEIDGAPPEQGQVAMRPDGLIIDGLPQACTLDIETEIGPATNTALSGLYESGGNLTTQCEPEGFRRITYFPDRPDVLARYTVTLLADRQRFPVLLSNGNRVDAGETGDGRHWAKWVDPFPKPSYLFALVAGDLEAVRDRFVTRSGRVVELAIYVRAPDLDKCDHAMESLKASMRWDEAVFGLEYDLDIFNIVAVSDFNMGAMENKSLNIFNTALVLAKPETATDTDYHRIESVVAHEYFHNWTGNRITCRDWFQLTLKEGLTVFRDQLFSADQGDPTVQRIVDVRRLRAAQFPEDQGPLAHPIRPESYIEINNFYTPTVYEKGAEVIRMIHTLLGHDRFMDGMRLYVERHDGRAVTCEDFVAAMEDAGPVDLTAFRTWYRQAGTPTLTVSDAYDAAAGTYRLHLRQTTPPTPGQPDKDPVVLPIRLGLVGVGGGVLPVTPDGDEETVVVLDRAETVVEVGGLTERPVPSLLRGFSAPVRIDGLGRDALEVLFAYDPDPFGRWEAGQQLATDLLLEMVATLQDGGQPALSDRFVEAFARTLADDRLAPALKAEALALPGEDFLADRMAVADPVAIFRVRDLARRTIATRLREALAAAYDAMTDRGPFRKDGAAVGRRALKNLCLGLLGTLTDDAEAMALVDGQMARADNMTDSLAALAILNHQDRPERAKALAGFYDRWREEALVIDKWFSLQAATRRPAALAEVEALLGHPDFTLRNPNRVRALVGGFAGGNPLHFHDAGGSGYAFLADQVLALDPLNPQMAARLLTPLGRWRRVDASRQALMTAQLSRILAAPDLSRDSYEIASKSLEQDD